MAFPSSLKDSEKIAILLSEYTSLRTEVMQRNTLLNQGLFVSGTTLITILSFSSSKFDIPSVILISLYTFFVIVLIRFVRRDTRYLARHLKKIEAQVNNIAKKKLLTWETTQGIITVGYINRWREFVSPGAFLSAIGLSGLIVTTSAMRAGKFHPIQWAIELYAWLRHFG